MEENKKISELDAIQNISNTDEFIVIDKDVTSGNDASSSGKTSKVTLAQLKNALHTEGQKGNVGEDGIKGKQGDDGEQGESGEQGDRGEVGNKGQTGAKGISGGRGQTGEQGDTGGTGIKGIRGAVGEPGQPGTSTQDGDEGDPGPVGEKGLPGNKGERGYKGGRSGQGIQGLRGYKGDRGPTADKGERGLKGYKGDKANKGAKGLKGYKGNKGKPGSYPGRGALGASGEKGDKGLPGEKGYVGGMNYPGKPGETGFSYVWNSQASTIVEEYRGEYESFSDSIVVDPQTLNKINSRYADRISFGVFAVTYKLMCMRHFKLWTRDQFYNSTTKEREKRLQLHDFYNARQGSISTNTITFFAPIHRGGDKDELTSSRSRPVCTIDYQVINKTKTEIEAERKKLEDAWKAAKKDVYQYSNIPHANYKTHMKDPHSATAVSDYPTRDPAFYDYRSDDSSKQDYIQSFSNEKNPVKAEDINPYGYFQMKTHDYTYSKKLHKNVQTHNIGSDYTRFPAKAIQSHVKIVHLGWI